MIETTVVSLKGQIATYGPRCDLVPNVIYVGRSMKRGKNIGSWDLDASDWANPFSAKKHGGAERAVKLYRAWLFAPEQTALRRRIVPELAGKTLACWCDAEGGAPCHGRVLASLADRRLVAGEPWSDHPESQDSVVRRYLQRETVVPAGDWAGAL